MAISGNICCWLGGRHIIHVRTTSFFPSVTYVLTITMHGNQLKSQALWCHSTCRHWTHYCSLYRIISNGDFHSLQKLCQIFELNRQDLNMYLLVRHFFSEGNLRPQPRHFFSKNDSEFQRCLQEWLQVLVETAWSWAIAQPWRRSALSECSLSLYLWFTSEDWRKGDAYILNSLVKCHCFSLIPSASIVKSLHHEHCLSLKFCWYQVKPHPFCNVCIINLKCSLNKKIEKTMRGKNYLD